MPADCTPEPDERAEMAKAWEVYAHRRELPAAVVHAPVPPLFSAGFEAASAAHGDLTEALERIVAMRWRYYSEGDEKAERMQAIAQAALDSLPVKQDEQGERKHT